MERVLHNKVEWLSKNTDWTIKIVTTDQNHRPTFFKFPPNIKLIDLDVNYNEQQGLSSFKTIYNFIYKRSLHKKRLTELLKKEKADIVVSLYPCESSFIPNIKDFSKKILELHFNKFFRLQYGRSGLIGLLDKVRTRLDNLIVKKFDKFIVLTKEDEAAWGNIKNIKTIPNFLTSIPATPSLLTHKRIIAVGRLDYQKGFDKLLEAWALLKTKYHNLSDWHLDIFGQGEWHQKLNRMISDLNISDSTTINSPTSNINQEYLESSLLVMSSNYEGFGMVLVEAMACGLPCVSYSCPCGPRDIIEDGVNGVLVEQGNVEALADAMARVMSDDNLRLNMGREARKVTDRFSEDRIMAQWTALFSDLAK